MKLEMCIPDDVYNTIQWKVCEGGNDVGIVIGDHTGFSIPVGPGYESNIKLIHSRNARAERMEAILIKSTNESIQVLGKVRLPAEKLAEWAMKLIGDTQSIAYQVSVESADTIIKELAVVAESGLNGEIYRSHGGFAYNLCAILPWAEVGNNFALTHIINSEDFKSIAAKIKERDGVDYMWYFNAARNKCMHYEEAKKYGFTI